MMRVLLLLGSLVIAGVRGLSGPSDLRVHHGDSVEVTCYYESHYDNYYKYWCRGAGRTSCHIIVPSEDCRSESCRFSLVDEPRSHRFTVTMEKMIPADSDTYQCGIQVTGLDQMSAVKISVLPGVCKSSPFLELFVEFPLGFDFIKEEEEVEVSCREQFENRRFHLQCTEADDEFRLYSKNHVIPCRRRCVRTINWGQNVSVHPQQEYYDPDQEVTVTCPAGYQPNYGAIKCVRDNNTNTWNVTDISCEIGTVGDITTSMRDFLGSCVISLIPAMAVKFITVLVFIGIISVRRMKRGDRPTQKNLAKKATNVYKKVLLPDQPLYQEVAPLGLPATSTKASPSPLSLPELGRSENMCGPVTISASPKGPVYSIYPSPVETNHEVIYYNTDTMIPPSIKSSSC